MNIKVSKLSEFKFLNEKFKNEPAQIKKIGSDPFASEVMQTNTISSKLIKGAYGVLPFKAQTSKINFHKISFSAKPLYDINLKKLIGTDSYKHIQAKFSELIPDNIDDMLLMYKVEDYWSKLGKTNYTKLILHNFVDNKEPQWSHFVTEIIDDSKELSNRITCLLETTNPKKALNKNVFEIHFIQASPEIIYAVSPQIKGSGELSLYCAVKVAKENGFKKVQLYSANDTFYEKMGFKRAGTLYDVNEFENEGGVYELSSRKFNSFLKKVADKYELK